MWSYLGLSAPGAPARSALPSSPPPVPVPNGDEGSVVVDASSASTTAMMSMGDRGNGGSGGFRVSLPTHGTVGVAVLKRARGRSERFRAGWDCRARAFFTWMAYQRSRGEEASERCFFFPSVFFFSSSIDPPPLTFFPPSFCHSSLSQTADPRPA